MLKDFILYLKHKKEIDEICVFAIRYGLTRYDPEELSGIRNWRNRLEIWKMS